MAFIFYQICPEIPRLTQYFLRCGVSPSKNPTCWHKQRGASSRIPECLPSTILSVCSYRFMMVVFYIYLVSSRCHALRSNSSSSPYRARNQRVLFWPHFVALSRVKSLTGLSLTENINFSRVQKLGGRSLEERKNGYIRIYGSNDSNMLPLTLREQLPQQRIHISRTPI